MRGASVRGRQLCGPGHGAYLLAARNPEQRACVLDGPNRRRRLVSVTGERGPAPASSGRKLDRRPASSATPQLKRRTRRSEGHSAIPPADAGRPAPLTPRPLPRCSGPGRRVIQRRASARRGRTRARARVTRRGRLTVVAEANGTPHSELERAFVELPGGISFTAAAELLEAPGTASTRWCHAPLTSLNSSHSTWLCAVVDGQLRAERGASRSTAWMPPLSSAEALRARLRAPRCQPDVAC